MNVTGFGMRLGGVFLWSELALKEFGIASPMGATVFVGRMAIVVVGSVLGVSLAESSFRGALKAVPLRYLVTWLILIFGLFVGGCLLGV